MLSCPCPTCGCPVEHAGRYVDAGDIGSVPTATLQAGLADARAAELAGRLRIVQANLDTYRERTDQLIDLLQRLSSTSSTVLHRAMSLLKKVDAHESAPDELAECVLAFSSLDCVIDEVKKEVR